MENTEVSKTKVTIINFLTDAVPQVLIVLLGFFKIKIFMSLLGEAQLGLYQLYGQIIAYLVLIEGGVGSALLFRLYNPISQKNNEKINDILSAAKIIFRIIGLIIVGVGLILSFNIGFFIKDNTFSQGYMQFTFILYLISQAVYYFTIPYRTMFEADQKRYVPNLIFQIITILKAVIEIIIVSSGLRLIAILVSLIICSLVANLLIIIFFKRYYKALTLKSNKKDYSMLKDVKDLFINTLGNLLTNNIDIIIISKFVGLKYVVIYSTYNYFVEAIKQFVDKITGATMSSIGLLVNEEKDRAKKIFDEFNDFTFYLGTILAIPLFMIINQFIQIWYKDAVTTSTLLALLFAIILFYQVIRIPLKVFTLSTGKFKEVKNFVILEIVINLSFSLISVQFWGIEGVLLSTIISLFVADFATKPFVIFKKIFNSKPSKYYFKSIINMLFTVIIGIIYYNIFPKAYSSLWMCILFCVIITLINIIISTAYYVLTKQFSFFDRLKWRFLKK